MTLGEKIRILIKAKGYKTSKVFLDDLQALFEENAITRRTLTRLMHNRGEVRLRTLVQVAHVLGVTISSLKEGTDTENPRERSSPGSFTYNKKAVLHCLHRNLPFIPTQLALKPGGCTSREQDSPDAKDSLKWFYVVSGRVNLITHNQFGEEKKLLAKGESHVFDARQGHYFENASSKPATLIIVHHPARNNIFYTAGQ